LSGVLGRVFLLLAGSKSAHTNIENIEVRYVLPYLLP
jgi:hypothetical protein